jgi:guanylate kinase
MNNNFNNKRIIVISAPSGGGKSVVANYILENFPNICFSISSTTRNKREGEEDNIHYYFLSKEKFIEKMNNGEFVEYEEIYGNYYGTLKSEIEKTFAENRVMLFDIDVKGAYSIRNQYPQESLLIFLKPPSIEVLEQRLRNRKTESEEQIKTRLSRAKSEIEMNADFDYIVENNDLQETLSKVHQIIKENIKQ